MRLKKATAAFTAAIVAATSVVVAPVVAGAAGVEKVPDGTEEVLGTFVLDSSKFTQEFTGAWQDKGQTISVTNTSLAELAKDENVYVKLTASNVGDITTDSGATPFDTIMSWGWNGYSSWVCIGKMYKNWGDVDEYEITFAPTPDSTSELAYSYVPLSDFPVTGTTLMGNFQSGSTSGITIDSIELVRINTVEFETTTLNYSKNEAGNEVYLNVGTDLVLSKLSENAKLRFTFTTTADGSNVTAGWGCGAVSFATADAPNWWEAENQLVSISSPGPETQGTVEVKCSAIPADATQIVAQVYQGNGVFDKVELLDVKSEKPVETTYSVTVEAATNGSVTADKTENVKEGETVTLTVSADAGYELDTLKVATATADISVTSTDEAGKFAFIMPAEDVTVSAAFTAVVANPVPVAEAGDGEVNLTWEAVEGAAAYSIYTYLDGTYTKVTDSCTDTTYTVTGLTNGTEYGFVVSVKVNGKWTDHTDTADLVYATPIAAEQAKPVITNYKAGDYKVKLEWTALDGAEMYRVYTYADGAYKRQFTCDGTRNIATVTGLDAGKEYGFVVSAKVNGTWTDYTDEADLVFVTPTGTPKPSIVGYKAGNYKVKLEWKAVEGAEMYRVYAFENGVYTRKFTCSGSRNVATVTGLVSGTEYAFVVSAKANGVWTDYSNEEDLVRATPTGDPSPVITGYKTGDGKVKLTWHAIEGAEMYRVYTVSNSTFTEKFTTSATRTTATVSGLENGQEYGFVVSAKVDGVWTNYNVPELILYATPNA